MNEPYCDNCGNPDDRGNPVEVSFCEDLMQFLCMPCREAHRTGDKETFLLRRLYLKEGT